MCCFEPKTMAQGYPCQAVVYCMERDLVANAIVDQIEDREAHQPENPDCPLNDVIDTDALESLTDVREYHQRGSDLLVEFVYGDYTVTVDGTGKVVIREYAASPDELFAEEQVNAEEPIRAEINRHERALNEALEIISAPELSFEEQLGELLEAARGTLGTEFATLSYVDDETYVFEAVASSSNGDIEAGETMALAETTCKRVIESEQSLVIHDIERDAPELAASCWGVTSYLGVPVFVDDVVYGTFCFYDTEPRAESFSDWELTFIELLGNWIRGELEQRNQKRALHASTSERPYSTN